MTRIHRACLIIGISLLHIGCHKVDASFGVSNAEPATQEPVSPEGATSNAESYQWIVDGQVVSKERTPVFVFTSPGEHKIQLKVTGKFSKASREISINVRRRGRLMIWRPMEVNNPNLGVEIRLKNHPLPNGEPNFTGTFEAQYKTEPPWRSPGTACFDIDAPDTVMYRIFERFTLNFEKNGMVAIGENSYTSIKIQF